MKPAVLVLIIAVSVTHAYYVNPSYTGRNHNENRQKMYHELAKFFDQMSAKVKRCGNTFDESCINGALPGAVVDEDWLVNNSPGKRCANVFDESCIGGGSHGGGADQGWLGGNGTPGKR